MFDFNDIVRNPEFNYSWLLEQRAIYQPNKTAFIYLVDGEHETFEVTYAELDKLAKTIAGYLQKHKAQGERALLLYPSGIDYIAAFFGCLYAGVIAIPLYQLRNNQTALSRMHSVFQDAQAKFILSTSEHLQTFQNNPEVMNYFHNITTIATDYIDDSYKKFFSQAPYHKISYLQYTSGSTGNPKGVMVGHHNLLHNSHIIQQAWGNNESSTIISWLPLHHDFGLIGIILQAIYSGSLCVLMSPVHFVKKPLRWLQTINDYNGNISCAPNFAYDLCIEEIKPDQLIDLDLSSWYIACNGAEQVRPTTIEKFTRKFRVCGFNSTAFTPAYGMAEATLFTTSKLITSEEPKYINISKIKMEQGIIEEVSNKQDSRVVISCGCVLGDQIIKIVDHESMTEVAVGTIGEIWIHGPSVAYGYWNKPELNINIFSATLNNDTNTKYLRSGDLGFIKDGELYIVGRLKDLIIIRGKNYYPIDIEFSAEKCAKELKENESAAFSIDVDGKEELVIVQTIRHDEIHKINTNHIKQLICNTIVKDHEITPYDVVLVVPGQIPKTSSGKIQRKLSREFYLQQSFKIVA